jgi:hypothetical protein
MSMLILFAIFGVLLCLTCFFFFVVHPLICIVQCAISKNLSGGQKAIWIFLSLLVGIVGSLPYALFASGSTRMRSLTLNGLMFGALNLVLAIGVFVATPEIRDTLRASMGDTSMQSMVLDSTESTDSLAEISAIRDEQTNVSTQTEQPRFVSVVAPVPTAENTLDSNNLTEIDPKLENRSENTSSSEVLVVDAAVAGSVLESTSLPEVNKEATVTQENIEINDSTPNKPLESEMTTDNLIASESLPQAERRETESSEMAKREMSSKKKPINRYTLPNKTMPQPFTVRNRYKNP